MLKQLVLWGNGNVMAFDEKGDQICELQRSGVTLEDLKSAAAPETEFCLGLFWDGNGGRYIRLPAEQFWPWVELATRPIPKLEFVLPEGVGYG